MRSKWNCSLLLLGIFSLYISPGLAAIDPVSVFVQSQGNNARNYTFAVNIPSGSQDLYFHLSAPSDYSWVAVGTGSLMKNSMMFVVYSNAKRDGVTVSPRLGLSQIEPVFSASLDNDIETLRGTGLVNHRLVVNARCSNCSRWKTGQLDMESKTQPWIFALGPQAGASRLLQSDSKTANIERHSEYGWFTLDMVQATGGSGGLPTSFLAATGFALDRPPKTDYNWPSVIHGLALCATFVLLMPTGVLFLRVRPQSVRWHWINQSLASAAAILGGLWGAYLSTMFTKSHSFGSLHQLLGIGVILTAAVQWGLGYWHHRLFKMTQAPTRFSRIHRYVGPVVILLGVINGGIGLAWSYASNAVVVAYAVLATIIEIGIVGLVVWKRWRSNRAHFKEEWTRATGFVPLHEGSQSNVQIAAYPDTQYSHLL